MRLLVSSAVLVAALALLTSGCRRAENEPPMPASFGPNQVVLEVPGMT